MMIQWWFYGESMGFERDLIMIRKPWFYDGFPMFLTGFHHGFMMVYEISINHWRRWFVEIREGIFAWGFFMVIRRHFFMVFSWHGYLMIFVLMVMYWCLRDFKGKWWRLNGVSWGFVSADALGFIKFSFSFYGNPWFKRIFHEIHFN